MKDEERLVQQVLEGDAVSFEHLLRPHRQSMLNIAYQITGNATEAEEVCQEAMIKVYKHLNTYKIGKNFRNWVLKIVTNSGFDYLRREKRQKDLVEKHKHFEVYMTESPEKDFLNQEMGDKIKACLSSLTPKEKLVFYLRDAEGFTIRETALILKSSSMSIRTHLSRARQKIRNQFVKLYPQGYGRNHHEV